MSADSRNPISHSCKSHDNPMGHCKHTIFSHLPRVNGRGFRMLPAWLRTFYLWNFSVQVKFPLMVIGSPISLDLLYSNSWLTPFSSFAAYLYKEWNACAFCPHLCT